MSITFFMGAGPAVKPVRHFLFVGVYGRPLRGTVGANCIRPPDIPQG